MKIQSYIIIGIILPLLSCSSGAKIVKTESETQELENGKKVYKEITLTINETSNALISRLTKLENKDDDYKTALVSGIKKEDGLTEWMLDSLFYSSAGFDTTIVSYKKVKGEWVKNQLTQKKYNNQKRIEYFKTERFNDRDKFSKEVFYTYSEENNLLAETEFECSAMVDCDSLFKKRYFYNQTGKLDSTSYYTWSDKKWELRKKKNNNR